MYSSKLEGYTIESTDKKEFEILQKEIFKNNIYSIALKNEVPLIIDCGAHIGLSIISFKLQYPNSKIIALEPNPIVFPILKHNIEYNRVDGIELIIKAVDTQEGSKDFYIDTDQSWLSTGGFKANSWQGTMKTKAIKVNTIDINNVIEQTLTKYQSKTIDLLKIDIEGYEYTIIKYLNNKNKFDVIENIIFEYHPINENKFDHLMELLELLSKKYTNISFLQEGKSLSLEDIDISNLLVVKCSIM
ncbi:MAG TPA: FkbM family methyltransferase [Candidatus Dojkabacteria bacterium]|nr:FkbM family methyltransferase [Candidatus Dojkabacteria bacterium]